MSSQQVRFHQILAMPGANLTDFFTEPPVNLFPDATNIPPFFESNLLSSNRTIKTSNNDVHNNIRLFYLHLFRLAYQIDIAEQLPTHQYLTNLKTCLLHPSFEILFTPDTEPQRELYNDVQFKKLFCQALVMLDQEQAPDVEYFLDSYPILDIVMIHILRSVLAHEGQNGDFYKRLPTEVVFFQLSGLLGLTVVPLGSCLKFQESDHFYLEESDSEVYLVYTEGEEIPIMEDMPLRSNDALPNTAISMQNVSSGSGSLGMPISVESYSYQSTYPTPIDSYRSPLDTYAKSPEYSTQAYNSYRSPLEHYAKQPIQDISPALSDYGRGSNNNQFGSLNIINTGQYEPSYKPYGKSREQLMEGNPRESMISLVSETYEFVDFTNNTTVYKEKVPRNKLGGSSNSSPVKAPVVHLNREQGIVPNDALFDRIEYEPPTMNTATMLKNKVSPIYESAIPATVSLTTGYPFNSISLDADYSKDTPMNSPYSGATYGVEQPKYSYQPQYQTPMEFSKNPYSYQEMDQLNSILDSIKTTQTQNFMSSSSKPPSDATPIYKVNQRQVDSQIIRTTQSQMVQSADKALNGSIGDYYKDFTSSFTLQKVEQPFKSKIRAVKNRIRGLKRGGVGGNFLNVPQKPVFNRVLYQAEDSLRN